MNVFKKTAEELRASHGSDWKMSKSIEIDGFDIDDECDPDDYFFDGMD